MAEPVECAEPLAGRLFTAGGIRLEPAPPAERMVLRAPDAAVESLSRALGLSLPRMPKTSASQGGRAALWLGPDEWLVLDETGRSPAAACAGVSAFHSAVDVSHRNTAILVSGARAADVLNAGCPQDLSSAAFPVGGASRTVFGKAEIVLWRTGETAFRVECWRSFSDYVFMLLEMAARDA